MRMRIIKTRIKTPVGTVHSAFYGLDMPTCKSGLCGALDHCWHDAISDTDSLLVSVSRCQTRVA